MSKCRFATELYCRMTWKYFAAGADGVCTLIKLTKIGEHRPISSADDPQVLLWIASHWRGGSSSASIPEHFPNEGFLTSYCKRAKVYGMARRRCCQTGKVLKMMISQLLQLHLCFPMCQFRKYRTVPNFHISLRKLLRVPIKTPKYDLWIGLLYRCLD